MRAFAERSRPLAPAPARSRRRRRIWPWLLLIALLLLVASRVRFVDAPVGAPPRLSTVAAPAAAGLVVPVAGVTPAMLVDRFGDARTGHVHGALDIMAPRGTIVVAAGPGRVEKLFESQAGGHTVYVRSRSGRYIHYYAHLDSYAPGLREGMEVAQGQALGTVGSSGNADPAGPHLHFEVKRMAPGQGWWQGRAVNPYPLLASGA